MALTLRDLRPELLAVARAECNENAAKNAQLVESLLVWIDKSAHLQACCHEQLLLTFLRRCSFRLEDSKRRIDGYYALRNVFPEVLCQRQLTAELLQLFQRGIHIIPMRPVSATGPRLIISQFAKIDAKKSHPREAFKLLFMLLELLALECDNASVAGMFYVVDARDVSMEQMLQYDPFLLKKSFTVVEQCMPLRFTEIHMINMRREGQAIFNFVTSFLPPKLPWKFVVHKKPEDLYEHLPRAAMPIEYGGTNGLQAEALNCWLEKLQSHQQYFEQDAAYGTNEKLRVDLDNAWSGNAALGGTSGSFRKLEVD